MMTLLTGLPGNAKTLKAIVMIREWARSESRDVFYSGIKDLNFPLLTNANGTTERAWTEIDPKKWMDCPDGAIIFIDEAQLTFPKKPNGSELPGYYQELTMHRHHGFDMVFATQHPSLVDNFLRKLCQRHLHAIRKFGMKRSTYWEWDKVQDNPELPRAQKVAIGSTQFVYPKEAFKWYTSAAVHTVKAKIPAKLIMAVLLVLVVGAYAFYTISHMVNKKNGSDKNNASASVSSSSASAVASPFDAVADSRHFVEQATPRIVGLPQTAPKYDELTKPSRVPVPAMCIQHHMDKCKCYTQQGTAMDVQLNMCIEFARNGFFQEFDPDKDRQQQQVAAKSAEVLKTSPVGTASQPSQVVSFGYVEPVRPVAAVAAPVGSGSGRVGGGVNPAAGADVGRL